ncbi:MAG: hypothetical protein AABZ17_12065, partial [Nitrospirota bacterium]
MNSLLCLHGSARGIPAAKIESIFITHCYFGKGFKPHLADMSHCRGRSADIPADDEPSADDKGIDYRMGCQDEFLHVSRR